MNIDLEDFKEHQRSPVQFLDEEEEHRFQQWLDQVNGVVREPVPEDFDEPARR